MCRWRSRPRASSRRTSSERRSSRRLASGPYGVAIDVAAPFDTAQGGRRGSTSEDSPVLTVAIETRRTLSSRLPAGWPGALGAITFESNGIPSPVITVFLADIGRFIADTQVLGVHEWQWPRSLHDEVVGRVLGRVLAHEIGHFVLRMRGHTVMGLMRQVLSANEMVDPSRRRFTLSRDEADRLKEARR
jgi:hypothetical protein